jgi:hypothetical protein
MAWQIVRGAAAIAATALAVFLLYRVFERHDLAEIARATTRLTSLDFARAVGFAVLAYAGLCLAEYLAVAYARRRPLPASRVVRTTVAALGIGRSVGLAALSSGAIRYRMYSRCGLAVADVAKIVLFCGITVALGMLTLVSAALTVHGRLIRDVLEIDFDVALIAAFGGAALVALYPVLCAVRRAPLRVRKVRIDLPSWPVACAQIAIGTANLALIAATLHACLLPFADVPYLTVAALFVGAEAASVIGHVPGGWGVLEYVVVNGLSQSELIAGIVMFRAVFNLGPLGVGLAVFLGEELRGLHRTLVDNRLLNVKR